MYRVYILKCRDGSLYTGISKDFKRRIAEHENGEVPFTKNRRPIKVVHFEMFGNKKEAANREREIKGWRREKKEVLIRSLR